jgi:hypothetical protein
MRVARILTALIASLAVVAGVPAFLAFESHMVSVTARVVQPPPPVKKVRGGPDPVPVGTYQEWFFLIVVTNTFPTAMQNAVVTDHFGAELNAEPLDSLPVDVDIVSHTRGQSAKESFETQVRITWTIGRLEPGQSETLVLRLFTKQNPAGMQEYTSTGVYEQNSGAVLKWTDVADGRQLSAVTESISVTVIDPDADGDGFGATVDCDDADASVHPDGEEIAGNGKDDDCASATPDEPPPEPTATPSATPESTAREVPVVEPTATPLAAEATPTSTAEPVVEPSAVPTGTRDELTPAPAPTATPTPVAAEVTPTTPSTAVPVVEPSATPTGAAAVGTPTPTATPTATATPEGG